MEKPKYIPNLVFVSVNLIMVCLSCIYLKDMEKTVRVVTLLSFLTLCIGIPSINNQAVYKLFITLTVALSVVLIAYVALSAAGVLYIFKDFDIIKQFILDSKQWGVLVFLAITVLQVVVLPIPAAVTILIGVAIYGPFWSFVLSSIGTYIGSVISFYLGRTFGKKLVSWLFGAEKTEKYAKFLNEKGKGMFVIMLIFPFFPDDLICMVAGVSSMSKKFFLLTMLITRPLAICLTAFLGSGKIIPFSGWGIPVWIAIFAATVIAFLLVNLIKNKLAQRHKNKKT